MATEKRLIDANALVWSVGISDDGKQFFYVKAENIDNAPTVDAVEVVRCKDCKHWRGDHPEWFQEQGWGTCVECLMDTKADFFCGFGEGENLEMCNEPPKEDYHER